MDHAIARGDIGLRHMYLIGHYAAVHSPGLVLRLVHMEHSGLSGRLEFRAGEDKHELAEGDAIYFDSTVPHGYRRVGAKRTTALVVALGPRE